MKKYALEEFRGYGHVQWELNYHKDNKYIYERFLMKGNGRDKSEHKTAAQLRVEYINQHT